MHVCSHCRSFVDRDTSTCVEQHEQGRNGDDSVPKADPSSDCQVCLGLWADGGHAVPLVTRIRDAVRRALLPYGDPSDNCWSQGLGGGNPSAPSIGVPGDVVHRCVLAMITDSTGAHQEFEQDRVPSWETVRGNGSKFGQLAKERGKDLLGEALSQIATRMPKEEEENGNNDEARRVVEREEQGYLGLHVQLVPSVNTARPVDRFMADTTRKRKRRNFYGQPQQGGDPRQNLEQRLAATGVVTWTINQATQALVESKEKTQYLQHDDNLLDRVLPSSPTLDVHVAVWRRPIYVRGEYTKSCRDVPQSPFFVVRDGNTVRLGSTSVEEQIVPVVAKYCGGMSTMNNPHGAATSHDTVFGATKFHASGREDIDVRMLIRPKLSTGTSTGAGSDTSNDGGRAITGRPFVCEVIDALRMPTEDDLAAMAREINHVATNADAPSIVAPLQTAADATGAFTYGCNPTGVGVSALALVPAAAFRGLQSETEHKVKHYGCLCWSEAVLSPTVDTIATDLGWTFPLKIAQRTPLRVLHRRTPATRTRHILTGSVVERVDDHYFRLRLSTDAGTYVKEFVHGDLGRTVPSVSSMLRCRTDILELDCEGVET